MSTEKKQRQNKFIWLNYEDDDLDNPNKKLCRRSGEKDRRELNFDDETAFPVMSTAPHLVIKRIKQQGFAVITELLMQQLQKIGDMELQMEVACKTIEGVKMIADERKAKIDKLERRTAILEKELADSEKSNNQPFRKITDRDVPPGELQ